jgi:putative membrane protein
VGRGVRRWSAIAFGAAIATLLVALTSPLDPLAEDLFSAHMAQHVLLAVVAPPLLVVGSPAAAFVWALPPTHRSRWGSVLVSSRWPILLSSVVHSPVLACAAYAMTLWSWHLRAAYELALRSDTVHALEHASLVGAGCWLWWAILHGRRARRDAYGVGLLALFVTMLHSAALGALVALSRHVWYPAYAASATEWGWNPLRDQQLAGLIMWVPGGLLHLAAMSVLFVAWLRATERQPLVAGSTMYVVTPHPNLLYSIDLK